VLVPLEEVTRYPEVVQFITAVIKEQKIYLIQTARCNLGNGYVEPPDILLRVYVRKMGVVRVQPRRGISSIDPPDGITFFQAGSH
jgi:hypothetical protein